MAPPSGVFGADSGVLLGGILTFPRPLGPSDHHTHAARTENQTTAGMHEGCLEQDVGQAQDYHMVGIEWIDKVGIGLIDGRFRVEAS